MAQIPHCMNAFCKYQIVHGEDWRLLDGMEEGLTQMARQASGSRLKATVTSDAIGTYILTQFQYSGQSIISLRKHLTKKQLLL